MVFDHIQQFMPFMPLWFRYLGRIVAPVFFFLIVEGFFHTHSVKRYILRLFAAGLAMSVGSGLLVRFFPTVQGLQNNIFYSLGLGVILMWAFQWSRTATGQVWGWAIITLAVVASFFTEAHYYGIMMVFVFYHYRDIPGRLAPLYCLGALLPILASPMTLQHLLIYDYQWMMIFALPILLAYNGAPGPRTPTAKWFFYIFYPVHIWIIYILGYYVTAHR